MFPRKTTAAAALLALGLAGPASAALITGWNLGNVQVTAPTGAGTSVIYDRDPANVGARSSARIDFDGVEGFSPGLRVENDTLPQGTGQGGADNCVMANSATTCNGPMQSGKRFKFQRTGTEAVDLRFETNPQGQFTEAGNDGLYRVFQKYGNDTDGRLTGFTVSLGTGIGAGYAAMAAGDGLAFTKFDPAANSTFSALYAAGLFGNVDEEHPFGGYFSPDRAGYGLAMAPGATSFSSTGMFGAYETLFGDLLSYSQVPNGYFFDHDGDASTDAILVAHQLADGTWMRNRSLEDWNLSAVITQIAFLNGGDSYSDLDELQAAFIADGASLCSNVTAGTACLAGVGAIEDLAKFNLTFFLDPRQYADSDFTLRFEASVPEPSSVALAGLALAGLGFGARRRKAAVA